MKRRVLIAKKRGRLAGALLGAIVAGPLGALAGAALNSRTDYYENVPDSEKAAAHAAAQAKAAEQISPGVRRILLVLAGLSVGLLLYTWLSGPLSPFGG